MTIQPLNPATGSELSMPAMPGATGIANLESWVNALGHANHIASFMARSNFVPLPLRRKDKSNMKTVEELTMDVTAIIMAGASVGYDPFQAVQQMFIVHGSPAMYARSMVALVKSHGHKVDQVEASAESVTVRARHRDETEYQEFTWTLARAERAGYTSNPKYRTNPQEMLYAKAATEACRRMFPEVLSGISPYSVEESELEDLGESVSESAATSAPKKTTKLTRKPKAAVPPKPAPPEQAEAEARAAAPAAEEPPLANPETGEMFDMPPAEDAPQAMTWQEELDSLRGDAPALRDFYNRAAKANLPNDFLQEIAAAGTEAANQ